MTTTKTAMAPMKVAQISKAGSDFQIVEREIPKPGVGHVRIQVQACGVCHSDVLTKEGAWPGIQYPRVPGHEVAGLIDEVCGTHVSRTINPSAIFRSCTYSRTVRSAISHSVSSCCIRTQMRWAVWRCLRGAFRSRVHAASIQFGRAAAPAWPVLRRSSSIVAPGSICTPNVFRIMQT